MDVKHPSSCWNSILEKVQPQIPTVDLDFSSSEKDEIAIYQRPAGLSLKVPEDFDSFSIEDAELEELLKSVTEASEEICRQPDDGSEPVENRNTTQRSAPCSQTDLETGAGESSKTVLNNEAKQDASFRPNADSTKSHEGFPVLSFARLDEWDDVPQNLKDDRSPVQQYISEPRKLHANGDRSPGEIMERLVAFCNKQPVPLSEPMKSPNCIRQNIVCNKSAKTPRLNHQEPPTVYIDLRCPVPSIKPAGTSTDLSSGSSTHQETPPARRHIRKSHIGSQTGDREMTGKGTLLQKIRETNRNSNPRTDKCAEHSRAEETEGKTPPPLKATCSRDPQQPSPVQSRKANKENSPTVQQRSVKETKRQSVQQRVRQTFQRDHSQILAQLEKHRPTKSVYLKQPAAERTDVLYESEASHLDSISTVPADIKNEECVLLIIHLSSPGVVVDRAQGKRKHLYPAATRSHIYNTLVAWFLSLADTDLCHDVGAKVPFWVAGLQQLWTENGLALHVLAVARHSYTTGKRDTDIHTPFYNHICRFLSETSLTVIASWLPHLKNLLDQDPYVSPILLPSSSLNHFISANSGKDVVDRTFGLSPGFYWQTVETQEHVCKGRETTQELHTEVSVVLGSKDFFQHPLITHYTLHLVLDSGLDVCGLRLLHPPQEVVRDSVGVLPVNKKAVEPCQPTLAISVRGPYAHSLLKDLTSSLDPLLWKQIEQSSTNNLHCRNPAPQPIHSTQLASRVHSELCLWFSGRFQGGSGAQIPNQQLNRAVPSVDGGSFLSSSRPSSFLCATTKADLLLVVSPVVPPCCYGQVLAVCERRGFGLRGLQRLQLQSHSAAVLGLNNHQRPVFCSPPTDHLDQEQLKLPSHCLVLLLRKENALRHSVTLPSALMREFQAQKLLGYIYSGCDHAVEPSLCFHTAPYNSTLFQTFVRSMWAVPDPSRVILSHQKCPSSFVMEQVVILTLSGKDVSQGLSLLHRLLIDGPEGYGPRAGFKLLGLKRLPFLTRYQAQELSPYEVGEQLWYNSVDSLMSSPALVCALRGTDAFASLRKLLPHSYPHSLSVLMSPTPTVALRQTRLFFSDHETIPDRQMLLTVCLFKPRDWTRTLAEILCKIRQRGLMLVGLRLLNLDKSAADSLLPAESQQYPCSGSSVALCLQGEDAVKKLLDVLSQEDSSLWTTCYGSGSYQQAAKDVKRLFPEGLCCPKTSTVKQEQVLSLYSDSSASVEREHCCTMNDAAQESLSTSIISEPNGAPERLTDRALWQTTCLLIPLNASPHSQAPSQLEMVEQLLRSGCHLVAGRTSTLGDEQRKHIAETLAVSGREKMAHFHTAPCLIMALQGEEIVAGFSLILKSISKGRPDLEVVAKTILYPESEKEAKQLIRYLFNALSPESSDTTVPQRLSHL